MTDYFQDEDLPRFAQIAEGKQKAADRFIAHAEPGREDRHGGRVKSLQERRSALASPTEQLRILRELALVNDDGRRAEFHVHLAEHHQIPFRPGALEIFQINLGKLCNMSCSHCHVDAGPDRVHEIMDRDTIDDCLRAIDQSPAHTVDITGGAPELNPHFRYLVDQCVARGKHVIDRCNLSVLLLPRCDDLPVWLAARGVEIISSLPHYQARCTDAQRGEGTFHKSIEALTRLNEAGYGQGDPRRVLTLMSNPAGSCLAGSQAILEPEWKRALAEYGVRFDRLIALNNMPISRFLEWLMESGDLGPYMGRLLDSFNPATLEGLMCRNTISVSWDGRVFDCDFNQMLDMASDSASAGGAHISAFDPAAFAGRNIRTARHCYGCTAGAGSSCGGAIADTQGNH